MEYIRAERRTLAVYFRIAAAFLSSKELNPRTIELRAAQDRNWMGRIKPAKNTRVALLTIPYTFKP